MTDDRLNRYSKLTFSLPIPNLFKPKVTKALLPVFFFIAFLLL